MGAPINPIPNISNTQYSYTPFLLNLGVIIKHPKPPNLATLKLKKKKIDQNQEEKPDNKKRVKLKKSKEVKMKV